MGPSPTAPLRPFPPKQACKKGRKMPGADSACI